MRQLTMDSITAQQMIDALLAEAQGSFTYAASLNNCLGTVGIAHDQAIQECVGVAYMNAAHIVAQHSGISLKIQRG